MNRPHDEPCFGCGELVECDPRLPLGVVVVCPTCRGLTGNAGVLALLWSASRP
jgi:hypothetical protein